MRKVNVLGVHFAVTNYTEASQYIVKRAMNNQPTSVYALPVHGVVEASRNLEFKHATSSSDLIVPDGQPVRWFMNLAHGANLKDRVYGPELVKHVLAAGEKEALKLFLYGGATDEILRQFAAWIEAEYPRIELVGAYREPSFGKYTLDASTVNSSGANILLCGLGCPNQELWISRHQNRTNAVLIGVGAAFSFHSGSLSVAPKFMQNCGLEWLYRLVKEPRRLWKRYLFTNTRFLFMVFRHTVLGFKY